MPPCEIGGLARHVCTRDRAPMGPVLPGRRNLILRVSLAGAFALAACSQGLSLGSSRDASTAVAPRSDGATSRLPCANSDSKRNTRGNDHRW